MGVHPPQRALKPERNVSARWSSCKIGHLDQPDFCRLSAVVVAATMVAVMMRKEAVNVLMNMNMVLKIVTAMVTMMVMVLLLLMMTMDLQLQNETQS